MLGGSKIQYTNSPRECIHGAVSREPAGAAKGEKPQADAGRSFTMIATASLFSDQPFDLFGGKARFVAIES